MTERRKTLCRIDINSLTVDPAIQRPLDGVWVKKIAANFNADSMGARVVSRRADGTCVVLDGQHSNAAALVSGFTGKVPCLVYEGLEIADEASLFLTLNNSRKVQAIDRFRVRVIEGDKAAVQMNSILGEYHWQARNSMRPGCFSAVTALEFVYDGAGTRRGNRDDVVRAVISTITCAWGKDYQGANAAIVGGLGQLISRFPSRQIDFDRLVNTLAKQRPVGIIARAKQQRDASSSTLSAATAMVIHADYNKGLRSNRLPPWVWSR